MITSISGLRYPVEAIGALLRPDTCRFIVDAAQAIGQIPVDVTQIGCDAFVATCRKWLCGPRGAALFWTNPDLPQNYRPDYLQPFDQNVALALGLGKAVQENLAFGIGRKFEMIQSLAKQIDTCLQGHGFSYFNDHVPMSGSLTYAIDQDLADRLQSRLCKRKIITKFPIHTVDEPCTGINGMVKAFRISPNIYNNAEDVDVLLDAVTNDNFVKPLGD